MSRVVTDNDFNAKIVRGARHRLESVDAISVRDVDLGRAKDPAILAWAAEQGCVVVTHDVSTMTAAAYDRIRRGEPMHGLIVVPQSLGIGEAIRRLVRFLRSAKDEELKDRVHFL